MEALAADNFATIFRGAQIGFAVLSAIALLAVQSDGKGAMSIIASSSGFFLVGMIVAAAAGARQLSTQETNMTPVYIDAGVGMLCLFAATALSASWADALERDAASPVTSMDMAIGMGYLSYYACNICAVTGYRSVQAQGSQPKPDVSEPDFGEQDDESTGSSFYDDEEMADEDDEHTSEESDEDLSDME
eukprot:TRINITY_DN11282_c0_g2_i2.p1 TRINITY_DN11282_c0_g2~~TRINITY_DN11282_c0_g2_i2.p1  ORF type:complete len:215 (+),score=26.86 TRINITY_DN11282_c0_g2_i2:77-646(+)